VKNLSIVIITKNEEQNIAKCLDSIKDLSDDIIVVDSGSEDDTENICKKYNLTFVFNEFEDYSSQKNFGNNLAVNNYILSIDADEVLSLELKRSIIELDFDEDSNIAYSNNRLNFHCGKPIKHGGWYPDKKIRIWNKNYGRWEGKIHEELLFAEKPKTFHLNGDLLHYTYHSREEHIKQALKFSRLNAEKDFNDGKKTNYLAAYLSSCFRFISVFIFKLGFLDGKTGFFIAQTTSRATFLRKTELIKLNRNTKK